jgi:hypothetical protein
MDAFLFARFAQYFYVVAPCFPQNSRSRFFIKSDSVVRVTGPVLHAMSRQYAWNFGW